MKKLFAFLAIPLFVCLCVFVNLLANTPIRLYGWTLFSCWSDQCEIDISRVYPFQWRKIVVWNSSIAPETPSEFWKNPNLYWTTHDEAMRGCLIADFLDERGDLQKALFFSCLPDDVFAGPRLIDLYFLSTNFTHVEPLVIERDHPRVCLIRRSSRIGLMSAYSLAPSHVCSN